MSVKSPRLSPTMDFGKKWFDIPCSKQYTKDLTKIFDDLEVEQERKNVKFWRDLDDKQIYYDGILDAFLKELCSMIERIPNIASLICQYIIGKYDFYMIMKFDDKLTIKGFNMHSTLNKSFEKIKPSININQVKFPTRIIEIRRKNHNLIIAIFDEGWQISFRIHNASSRIQNSVKLEMNFVGLPSTLYTHQDSL